jgi:hypothetical protein
VRRKLDELIRVSQARNRLTGIENCSEVMLELQRGFEALRKRRRS